MVIGGYFPSDYEVNIVDFLENVAKKKIKIVLPVIESSNNMSFKLWIYGEPLYVNNFGILEPKNTRIEIIPDLVLVPLVTFDEKLNRIGYGKGYYDRSLKKIKRHKKNMISVGIAYSFQKCRKIPINKYDFKLDYIFTEQGIISSK
ncbi:MAG: 5-formyltetrahydrofolate cyclo-ligase [Candidatus Pelagibacter sp.]|nr:5-formyltetrahydrofolate cyclo-ligase [Candidatus Pelagibacter sp.]